MKNSNTSLFEFRADSYRAMRGKSEGGWYCLNCKIEAITEHNKQECHLCADWNGCGADCTLSKVLCNKCENSMTV